MAKLKIGLWAVLVLLVTLGAGWLWGSTGRWAAEGRARDAEQRLALSDARAALSLARVDLFELNFGQASRDLERAKKALNACVTRYEQTGPADAATAARDALAKTAEGQQLAGSVDQTANARVAEALKALDRASAPSSR